MIIAGKYEVIGELGKGGMGVVYQARHVDLGVICAVKTVSAHLAHEPELLLRFQQEARVMAALRHPNLVRVMDVGHDESFDFLVMECVDGESLRQLLTRLHSLPLVRAISIALDVAAGLSHAHKHTPPVVHRDIKPSNILIESTSGRALVTDFGIAKLVGSDVLRTRTGAFIGTVKYCSPEQLAGANVDVHTDVFALGLVLYEMVSGIHPFEGLDESQLVARALDKTTEYPLALGAVPNVLTPVIKRALAKNPARRYRDMQEMLDALQGIERSLSANTISLTQRDESPTTMGRWRAASIAAVATLLVLVVVFLAGLEMQRTGYWSATGQTIRRSLGSIDRTAGEPVAPGAPVANPATVRTITVMDFSAALPDSNLDWMREVIRDDLSSRLSGASNCKVFSQEFMDFKAKGLLKQGTYPDLRAATMGVAADLGVKKAIFGRYRAEGSGLYIEAHVVDMKTGVQEPPDVVQGDMNVFVDLQGQLANKIMARLGIEAPTSVTVGTNTRIDNYKLLMDADGGARQAPAPSKQDRVSSLRLDRFVSFESRLVNLVGAFGPAAVFAEETGDARSAILETIERYRRAYQEKNLQLLATVYGSLSPEQSEAATRYFTNAQHLTVTIEDIDVAIEGDRAAVSFTRKDHFTDAQTAEEQAVQVRITKMMVQDDQGWTIAPATK